MKNTRFVLSVDDVATKDFSSPEGFKELLDFLKVEGVKATMFVVPFEQDIPLYDKKEWLGVLNRAIDEGHDLELHGLRHTAFEFGIPPEFILAYEHARRKEVEDNRLEIERNLSVEKIEERLNIGLEILSKVFKYRPTGFRSPYLSTHENLFKAIKNCGIEWDSSLAINPKGWHYIRGDFNSDVSWLAVKPEVSILDSGVKEVPLTAEYTWYLKDEDIDRQFSLIKDDIQKVQSQSGVMVTLSHVGPMTGDYRAALKVYKKAFDYIREQNIEITTIKKAVEELK